MTAEGFDRQLQVASLSGEVDAVMRGIVEHLMELAGADGACLSTIEDGLAYFKETAGQDAALHGRTLPIEQTLGEICLRNGGVTVLRADAGPEVARCLTPGAGAIVLAPIEYDGAVRGILGVRSPDAAAFDDHEVEAVGLLARGAAVALRNAELVERLAGYRELYAQAADATLVCDLDGNVLDANDAAAALLWYPVDELRGMQASQLVELQADEEPGEELRIRRELRSERRFRRKDGVVIDVEYSSRVLDDGRVHTSLRDVTQRKLNEERLRTSLGRLHEIVQTQQEISALELDTERVTAAIVERTQRLTGADGAAVQWFDDDACVYHVGSGIAAAHVGLRVKRDASLSGACARLGEAVYAPDTLADPRVDTAAATRTRARSLICAPLYRDREIHGVLSVMSRRPGAFDELAVETTRLMAEFVSTVIRNANELETRRQLVTDTARALRALQESESRFRGAFHASSIGMALTALDGTFVQVNERFAEMLGYTVEELQSSGVRAITHPDDVQVDLDNARRLREGEIDSYEREKRYLRKDGSVMWGHLTVSVVRGYDGAPTHVVSHIQDVTAQREESLLFESMFERSVVPKLVADDDRRVVAVNEAAAELLGVPLDDAVGLTIDDLLADEPVEELWSRFLEGGAIEHEATLHRPDGGRRRIEFAATADVRPGRHIAVVRDLTRQKDLEAQLVQAQKMEAVGRLAGGIAHDFNNLLTAISGYSEFLIAGEVDERSRRHAHEIKKAAARAAALTGQLLAFSRRQVLQPRVLDLNAVVSDMDMMLRRLIGEDVELVATLDPALGAVRADPTQVEQVIVNLAVNARDAMPNGGALTIETGNVSTSDEELVELRVTDSGVGMTEEERLQLFEPFFTTKTGGTGLGLATVYGIVEQSGGTIEVESAPGFGSSFRILLPRVEAPAQELPEAEPEATPRPGTETVLLVEDEVVVRRLVAELLESDGYTVLQAGDGPSALELLRRHPGAVDLLVTDVVMPGMSGPEVVQAVTAMRPGTHVLYTSGYTDTALDHHGVLEPGTAFLQKPFGSQELLRSVRALLDDAVAVD